MVAAAMRPDQFFFAAEPPWNHPESVSALPHRVTLSPYIDILRAIDVTHLPAKMRTADGNGGGTEQRLG
jgi:hypothetical protein